jgi:trehalose 6-phosphate synthase
MDLPCSGIELLTSSQEIIVVSNREPCIHDLTTSGDVVVRRPASGLVTALEPVVQQSGGVWIAHGSGSADRLSADRHGHLTVDCSFSSYLLRRVWLTTEEERGYYYGFANEGLWPLCHRAFSAPIFRRSDWIAYRTVNERFTEAIVEEARTAQPIVLVQDYHFALLPRLLRERCSDAIIVAFWHIPWPDPEQCALCPYWRELVSGLLGSDIVGFQTPAHCEKFVDTVDTLHEWAIDRRRHAIEGSGRAIEVRSYPISVEWPNRWTSCLPPVDECRRMVCARCGIDDGSSLIVSVDRLDYTKGFEERLAGIERLFEIMASNGRRVAFLQVAAPTRVAIERYGELAARVRTHIARINGRFGDGRFVPVTYVDRYMEPADVFQCYRAADVCYVGSLDDGMNLVAKEFVAARDDETGVLVLSQFAGAARELIEALIVNPYDVDGVAEALVRALDMSQVEQQARMREMRKQIAAHNVYNWASEMLADAARVRQRDHGPSVTMSADFLTSSGDPGDLFVRSSLP